MHPKTSISAKTRQNGIKSTKAKEQLRAYGPNIYCKMKVTVDFKAAFPQLEAKSDEKTLNTTQNKIRPGENTVVVFIYDKGLLLSLFLKVS